MITRILALLLFLGAVAFAAPPGILNHQGRIAVNGVNFDAVGFFKFALVNGSASETYWSNDGTASGEPASAVSVTVTNGHYAVLLGDTSVTNMTTPITSAIFESHSDVRLRVWFSTGGAGPFDLLSPDRRITTAGYAFSSGGASLTAGYETGSGADLSIQSTEATAITLTAAYNGTFSAPPTVDLDDAWSLSDVTTSGFTASAALTPRTIHSDGIVGAHASLAVINGRPAIAFRDDADGDLHYLRALDSHGNTWSSTSAIEVAGALTDVGQGSSLVEVDGRPAIAYYNSSSGDLEYVRANDSNGSSWPLPIRVDGLSDNVGIDASLAVIDGVPAISYQSPNDGVIHYAWASDAAGTTWNTTSVDGSLTQYSKQTSLASVLGKPAIAYRNETSGTLRYAYLSGSDPSIASDWTKVNVDTTGNVGMHPSLEVVNGRPAIAYYDFSNSDLKFARAGDAAGASWPAGNLITVEASSDDVGTHASLAVVGGRPAISYLDATAGNLKWAVASDANGSAWSSIVVDSALANVGAHSSQTSLDGLPAIAYQDRTTFDLKFASLPSAAWSAENGPAQPILASGVKDGGVTAAMLNRDLGVWDRAGDDLIYNVGRVGIGRTATANALEVEGFASKTTAGSWLANSDKRIKADVKELRGALDKILKLRLVDFEYTPEYREVHPSIDDRRFPNVIAQEFAEVFPQWVQQSGEEDLLQVDTYPILIYSAAAVQELAEQLKDSESQNAALLERLEALEAKVESLR